MLWVSGASSMWRAAPDVLTLYKLGWNGLERETNGGIGLSSHSVQHVEELSGLADEETIRCEALDGSDGAAKLIGQRTNNRDMGKVGVDEFARNGKDQAGLNEVGRLQWGLLKKSGNDRPDMVSVNGATGCLHSISRKIDPFQKVSDLVSTNTKGDLKHLRIRNFLTHGCVGDSSRLAQCIHSERPLHSRLLAGGGYRES